MNATIMIRELGRLDAAALCRHFLALEKEDRRLRFGVPLPDGGIRAYVERINFERDTAFGVFDDDLELVGVAHLARDGLRHAELGVSVLPADRRRGLGAALLARAHLRARNWGVRALFMHCLTENSTMMGLARRQGMRIVAERGEADAWLELPPADAASYFGEVFDQRVAVLDYAFKQGRAWLAPGR
ncbi:MAG: N-acetyltransferase family protein [Clostridia bacterium]